MAVLKAMKIAQIRDLWYFMINVPIMEETGMAVLISLKIAENTDL